MDSVYRKFLDFVAIAGIVMLAACAGDNKPVVEETPNENDKEMMEAILDAPAFVMLNTHTNSRVSWKDDFATALDSIGNAKLLETFYNMFDTTHVYALVSVEHRRDFPKLRDYLNSKYPEETVSSIMMNEEGVVDLTVGNGDLYSFVVHRVKEFDNWYGTFMAMEGVKMADSIYIIGVFSQVDDSLNIGVLSRSVSLGKTAAYARSLEESSMLAASGVVSEPEAVALRKWDYSR